MSELSEVATTARLRLAEGQQALTATWRKDRLGPAFLGGRAALVDGVLREIWSTLAMPADCALVAVGGYGRGELYPGSDVDLLILLPEADTTSDASGAAAQIEQLVGLLWDIGLDIGHSVRTVRQCLEEAERDITVKTSLLEARCLTGSAELYAAFEQSYKAALQPAVFFKAKQLDQVERYAKSNATPYCLDPNCKKGPGSRRDLQAIQWLARAADIGNDWKSLALAGLITEAEVRQFERADRLLRDLRIELHLLTGRREDRLLFDHQEKLAGAMGIGPTKVRRASEVLMQRYYRNAKLVTQLNALVMQVLADRLLPTRPGPPIIIDAHFQMVREQLDVREEDVFQRHPRAILECFLLQTQRAELKSMTPRTLRALWRAQTGIDGGFRRDPDRKGGFPARPCRHPRRWRSGGGPHSRWPAG